ncbi:MAG: hypothetical protein Q8K98_03220 [Bacteroidota bacterium]|nr:hypothetical protein [Bacteroidota bacterium]
MNAVCKILKPYLRKILNSSIAEVELTEFVHVCRSIVQPYLLYIRSSVSNLCTQQGLTITDLAYDCIADMFSRNDQNKFVKIENFANSLDENIDQISDINLFHAFKSFLTCIADSQLARLYSQADPTGSKIYRNLRDVIRASPFFNLRRDLRGLVVESSGADLCNHLSEFPMEELERELVQRVDYQFSTRKFLTGLNEMFAEQTQYRRSIPLYDLVHVLKKLHYDNFDPPSDTQPLSTEGLQEFEIEQICRQVEAVLKEKILLTYFTKGKIDRRQAEAICSAFHDMICDWQSNEEKFALFSYLKRYLDIDETEYEETLRPKMEYLLKIARNEFAARLMKEI